MINYIRKQKDNKLYVSEEFSVRILDTTFQKLLDGYLNKEFKTLKSIEKTIKKQLKFKSKVPIYIDSNNILMCIKSYRLSDSFYINYKAIFDYEIRNGQVYITFINYHSMKICEKFTFINQLKKCQKIIKYLNE